MSKEKKYKFPGFKCPNSICGAKNIAFAVSKEVYNSSKILLYDELSGQMSADYVIVCPKCKSHLIICNQSEYDVPIIF